METKNLKIDIVLAVALDILNGLSSRDVHSHIHHAVHFNRNVLLHNPHNLHFTTNPSVTPQSRSLMVYNHLVEGTNPIVGRQSYHLFNDRPYIKFLSNKVACCSNQLHTCIKGLHKESRILRDTKQRDQTIRQGREP